MVSGKYLPSQLRTQKAGPEPATRGAGAGWLVDWCRTDRRRSSTARGLPRLLFLNAAEQEIEQALGRNAAGHKHKRARKGRGGHKRRAGAARAKKPTLYATPTPPHATNALKRFRLQFG
jgi:hypothetical protein